ncbi:MAG: metallophosphoesterase [Luteolibacter sp.]
MKRLHLLALLISLSQLHAAPIVDKGSSWKYLDNGSNQKVGWREAAFDDSKWKSAPTPAGYGDDVKSTISFGANPKKKHITTYFRHSFSISNPSAIEALKFDLRRDDGAIIYLNGVEVVRDNMPAGSVRFNTHASSAVSNEDEKAYQSFMVRSNALVHGENVIAVELHQAGPASSDIIFDLGLSSGVMPPDTLIRGPYLQIATPTSMTVRWRGTENLIGRVTYGSSPDKLDLTAVETTAGTDHSVVLTGLTPDTTYYYSVGSEKGTIAGRSTSHQFTTSPLPGTEKNTRIWVLGDAGTANSNQSGVRDAFMKFTDTRVPEMIMFLGDNAYTHGTDAEYQAAVFNMYPDFLRRVPAWSTLGNHETGQKVDFDRNYPYFDIFTLPTKAEAGGVPSGTEHYYSYDYGNIHFICLDSMTADRDTEGPMALWLKDDLAATTATWIIAFWHHPPYTKGSHDSDVERELKEMRTNFLPILETGGVDLVLSGHSHSYERSFLIDGHYGISKTFTPAMQKDDGSGREKETGAYVKPLTGPRNNFGAVYVVPGSAGKKSGGKLNHPAMFVSLNQLGSLVLDINGPRLDATFVQADGKPVGSKFTTPDTFTILKKGKADTDKDGIPDEYEILNGLDFEDPADGPANLEKYQASEQ